MSPSVAFSLYISTRSNKKRLSEVIKTCTLNNSFQFFLHDMNLSLVIFVVVSLSHVVALLPISTPTTTDEERVLNIINNRTEELKKFIALRQKNCSSLFGTVGITLKYGRDGNLWMQYLNLIWLANHLNKWPVIPRHDKIFNDFDLSYLYSTFCVSNTRSKNHLSIHAKEIHGPHYLYQHYGDILPPQHSPEALETAADDALFYFASIYAGLRQPFVGILYNYIANHLNASLNYVVVQKRHFEGMCLPICYQQSRYSDFTPEQFDMTTPEWKEYYKIEQSIGNLSQGNVHWVDARRRNEPLPTYHPLCNMTASLILGAVRAHKLSNSVSRYFLMTDGQEPLAEDVAALNPIRYTGSYATSIDKHVAIHARLFIRNTASSFSLGADILRRILSLPTSGLSDNSTADFFFHSWFRFIDITTALKRRKLQQGKNTSISQSIKSADTIVTTATNKTDEEPAFVLNMHNFSDISDVMSDRVRHLKKFITLRERNCSSLVGSVGITSQYGREGNLWMQYLNLIWIARYLKRWPLINPSASIFRDFHLHYLESTFCTTRTPARSNFPANHLSIKASEIHGPFHLYQKYGDILPPQDSTETLESAADDALFYFASIYAGLKDTIIGKFMSYAKAELNASLNYVVIQKRHFEGICLPICYQQSRYSDFTSEHFDMTTPEWKEYHKIEQSIGNLSKGNVYWREARQRNQSLPTYHPLCNMTASLILGAVRAHKLSNSVSRYFLMTDGQEPLATDVAALNPTRYTGVYATSVDKLVAIHAMLFIRNTASSFSLGADILRRILFLPTSGLSDNSTADFFFHSWFRFIDITTALKRRMIQYNSTVFDVPPLLSQNFSKMVAAAASETASSKDITSLLQRRRQKLESKQPEEKSKSVHR